MGPGGEMTGRPRELRAPLPPDVIPSLRAGDQVILSGVLYTARDAAHERLVTMLARGTPLPVDLRGQVLYSCGPTTASRMDPYTPALLAYGVRGMIGKGKRSPEVREAIRRYGAVYFAAVEGTAALLGSRVVEAEVVAFPDLGPEAIYRLVVDGFPLVVANDVHGADLYESGMARFRREDPR